MLSKSFQNMSHRNIFSFFFVIFQVSCFFSLIDEFDSFPDLWMRKTRRIKMDEGLRCIAEFVNADPEDVVFVQNATTGIFKEN